MWKKWLSLVVAIVGGACRALCNELDISNMPVVMRRTQDLSVNEAALDQLAKLTGAQDGGKSGGQVSHHHHHSKIKGKWAQCGGWQPEYTNLHRSISSGMDERSRAFISKSPNSGLADRMVGILTGFYAALLSKRAFFLSTILS